MSSNRTENRVTLARPRDDMFVTRARRVAARVVHRAGHVLCRFTEPVRQRWECASSRVAEVDRTNSVGGEDQRRARAGCIDDPRGVGTDDSIDREAMRGLVGPDRSLVAGPKCPSASIVKPRRTSWRWSASTCGP